MPRYRFSWDAFADDALEGLARGLGHDPAATDESPREFLARTCKRPSRQFVKENKDAILTHWVSRHEGTARALYQRLVDAGLGPLDNRPRSHKGYVKFLERTRNAKSFQDFVAEAMIAFGDRDQDTNESREHSFVPRFAVVDVSAQTEDGRLPHDYQQTAWQRLGGHLSEAEASGVFQGLLVMPTGSGKTFTAVRWLATEVLARGGRVLWLAHRQELLSHAAAEFHRMANLASPVARLRIRIVSGTHCPTTSIDPADDVVVASISSLARRPEIRSELIADPRTFVVVDEAHHSPAKSYQDLLHELSSRKTFRVLGLTATPTRTLADERPVLAQLFGNRILYQIGLRTLIEQGTLSRPRLVRVTTGVEAEQGVTEKDLKHLKTFQDLSQEWLDRIAHLTGRNQTIIDHYLENRTRYGPTLIFAINVAHAALLCAQLREHGVATDYVASHRPDGSEGDTRAIIQRFREGALDVLVNVQMVTEGVDVPGIQTVFLARPTSSEILLRQMLGRALRGPAAGGTAEAYLVSFEDHWRRFTEWESPFDLVPDIEFASVGGEPSLAAAPVGDGSEEQAPDESELVEALPWDMVAAAARELRKLRVDAPVMAFEAIPHGWYVFEHEGVEDHDSMRHIVPFYAHQEPCWEACLEHLWALSEKDASALGVDDLEDFFVDCDEPEPATRDVELALTLRSLGAPRPEPIPFSARSKSAPQDVARRIWDADLGARASAALIEESYGPLARAVYPSLRAYQGAVDASLYGIRHPRDTLVPPKAVPIFELGDDRFLTPGPHHDLEALLRSTLAEGARLLGLDSVPYDGQTEWTRRLIKGWYGQAYRQEGSAPGHGRIRMSRLLDSPDVPESVLRYLLWHEYLHLYLRAGHTSEFRRLERLWPGHIDGDRFLDTLNERFGVQHW